MKFLLFCILVAIVIVKWDAVSNFVSGNLSIADKTFTQWLIDHTPKK